MFLVSSQVIQISIPLHLIKNVTGESSKKSNLYIKSMVLARDPSYGLFHLWTGLKTFIYLFLKHFWGKFLGVYEVLYIFWTFGLESSPMVNNWAKK